MLHLLPAELLILIIELSLPPDHAVSKYKERQAALTSYCLVNRKFREVAQPVLRRVFRPGPGVVLVKVLKSQPAVLERVRVFDAQHWTPMEEVQQALQQMPNLVVFSGRGYREGTLSFGGLSNLRSLTITNNLALLRLADLTFLSSLALCDVELSLIEAARFNPADLPNLRALYTSGWLEIEERRWGPLFLSSLHPQLDMLQVNQRQAFPHGFFSGDLPVLLTFTFGTMHLLETALDTDQLQHLQLEAPLYPLDNDWFEFDIVEYLRLGHRILRDSLPSLKSLCLPRSLHPSQPLVWQGVTIRNDILATCTARKVEVLWRESSFKPEDDYGVSREFWAYAKKLKAKKAAEAAASGEGA